MSKFFKKRGVKSWETEARRNGWSNKEEVEKELLHGWLNTPFIKSNTTDRTVNDLEDYIIQLENLLASYHTETIPFRNAVDDYF